MGTQIGNAAPQDEPIVAVDERIEDSNADNPNFTDANWSEDGNY